MSEYWTTLYKIGPSIVNFKLTGFNPYRPCHETDPTSSNIVEKLRTTTRWPNECNVLGPACWTQGSGTKIYLKSLENKLSPFWRFQVPFKVINRVTLSLSDSKKTAVPESGNCNSKCAVSRGLAPCRCEEPCEDPGRHCLGSSVPGSRLAKDPADTLAPCP